MLKKIISGGQTGVDRAALDAAIDCGFPYGGFVPKGRIAEDGIIPSKYEFLVELESDDYAKRTRKNIEESDATVIIHKGEIGKGTRYTAWYAEKLKKPLLEIDLSRIEFEKAKKILSEFIEINKIEILNVAGPRYSISPEVYELAYKLIKSLLNH